MNMSPKFANANQYIYIQQKQLMPKEYQYNLHIINDGIHTVNMKNNSINMAPKGRIPAINVLEKTYNI